MNAHTPKKPPQRGAQALARRREELVAISGMQRRSLQAQGQSLKSSLAVADAGILLLSRIRTNPLLMAGLALTVVLIKPRRLAEWLRTGSTLWRTVRVIVPFIAPMVQRFMAHRAGK
jgi:hypothetical protein